MHFDDRNAGEKLYEFTVNHRDENGEQIDFADVLQTGQRVFADGTAVQFRHPSAAIEESLATRPMSRANFFGPVTPPPDAEADRLRLRKIYLSVKLEKEEKAFTKFQTDVNNQINVAKRYPETCPAPGPEVVGALKRGQARIRAYREEIAAITQRLIAIPNTPESVAFHNRRKADEFRAKRVAELEQLQTEVVMTHI